MVYNNQPFLYIVTRGLGLNPLLDQLNPILQRFINHSKTVLTVALILLMFLAWFLGVFMMQLAEISAEPTQQSELSSSQSLVEGSTSARGIVSYLFGKPDIQSSIKPTVQLKDVKQSRLNLDLVGVIVHAGRGVAMIQLSGTTKLFFEGDEIRSRVVLLEVFADKIIVENNGVQESIALKRAKNILLTRKDEEDGSQIYSTREFTNTALRDVGKELKKSPMSIARFVKFKPIQKNGKWSGVKLWSKSDKELFNSVGFEEGDTLIEVNGASIQQLSKDPSLWQKFLKQDQFELVVERHGQIQNISVDLSGS